MKTAIQRPVKSIPEGYTTVTPWIISKNSANAETTFEKAIKAGATSVTELTPLFWGDTVGRVRDPFGNIWVHWTKS
jgi:uncharacterized glyoxalase superfamily protein PhnB